MRVRVSRRDAAAASHVQAGEDMGSAVFQTCLARLDEVCGNFDCTGAGLFDDVSTLLQSAVPPGFIRMGPTASSGTVLVYVCDVCMMFA